ncbi:olfactory receptor 52N4-like [Kryptolebias marmoratus]|uniref:Olfactory receptor, family 70, subfamily B, member 1 n=1 Tax=Kryptolebias marmoratus TaxID=37003 RepID=A0A3Q3A9F5_KRYMA|nr:olfactory receptor 52N4-like [Kryptolebias marmoratus]
MDNYTYNSLMLQLEGLKVTEDSMYLLFSLFLIAYVVVMFLNVGVLVLIMVHKNLHQPMYVLFCSLTVNDMIGSSHILPQMLLDILKPPAERLISYNQCVVQAFTTHYYGAAAHTVLMIMAFDRYVAICDPLRYSAVMTNKTVIKLKVSAWGVPFVLTGVLLGLTVRLSRCRTLITNPYCDNASLFKLSCESVVINNIYGLAYTVVLYVASVGSIVLTYTQITVVCLTRKNQSLNRKALKTCSTHLLVYLIMACSGFTIITLHRFPQYSEYRKFSVVVFVFVPGTLNPIIYGLQSKEIRKFMFQIFKSIKCFPFNKCK